MEQQNKLKLNSHLGDSLNDETQPNENQSTNNQHPSTIYNPYNQTTTSTTDNCSNSQINEPFDDNSCLLVQSFHADHRNSEHSYNTLSISSVTDIDDLSQIGAGIDSDIKFSYIKAIAEAIIETPTKEILLNDLYSKIITKYPELKNKRVDWQNGIRHNLSLNECFVKLDRNPNGKGHYWGIRPCNMDFFLKNDFRRRWNQTRSRNKRFKHVRNASSTQQQHSNILQTHQHPDLQGCMPPIPGHNAAYYHYLHHYTQPPPFSPLLPPPPPYHYPSHSTVYIDDAYDHNFTHSHIPPLYGYHRPYYHLSPYMVAPSLRRYNNYHNRFRKYSVTDDNSPGDFQYSHSCSTIDPPDYTSSIADTRVPTVSPSLPHNSRHKSTFNTAPVFHKKSYSYTPVKHDIDNDMQHPEENSSKFDLNFILNR